MKTQFNAAGGSPVPGSLYPTMTAQEEQQVAQQFVDDYKLELNQPFTDDEGDLRVITNLDLLAMAKHLENIGKLAYNMLLNDALRQTKTLIEGNMLDDKNNPIAANKQFEFHGNKWLYNLLLKYNQLGDQRMPDGTFDPNSQTYRSLEAQQEKLKRESKVITSQLSALKERILLSHPKLLPSQIQVTLGLKEFKYESEN